MLNILKKERRERTKKRAEVSEDYIVLRLIDIKVLERPLFIERL